MLQSIEKPLVNVCQTPKFVDSVSFMKGVGNNKEPLICGDRKAILGETTRVLLEAMKGRVNGTNGLLNGFLECPANRHHLSHRLHGGGNLGANSVELFKVPVRIKGKKRKKISVKSTRKKKEKQSRPAGHLDNDIIQAGLKAGDSDLGNRVLDFRKGNMESELCGNKGLIACRKRVSVRG